MAKAVQNKTKSKFSYNNVKKFFLGQNNKGPKL